MGNNKKKNFLKFLSKLKHNISPLHNPFEVQMLSIIFGELINVQKEWITRKWTRLCSLKWKPQIKSQKGIRFNWTSSTTVGSWLCIGCWNRTVTVKKDIGTTGLEASVSWLTWQLPEATKAATPVSSHSGKVWDYHVPSAISGEGSASSQWEAKHVLVYSCQLSVTMKGLNKV